MFVSQNASPYLAEAFVSTDKLGKKSLVVVVRATFDVTPGGTARVSDVQTPFVYADAHYGDVEKTSIQAESDFAPTKPRAEVLLNAYAVAPQKQPIVELAVGLVGPGIKKHAIVTGERYWAKGLSGVQMTSPKPFHSMPLAWHLAFGGTDRSHKDPQKSSTELRNPIGTGFHINPRSETIEGLALPCVEHPKHRMRTWSDTPEPIGFGPVSRFARSRIRFAGTFDQQWMDEVLPFLPQDFDERYFQAAPPDQQISSLEEGAEFTCLNMSADRRFVLRLPALNLSVTYHRSGGPLRKFVKPDTLIIEPHEERIVLLGRTAIDLPRKFTTVREVRLSCVGARRIRPSGTPTKP